eukprot:COSAG06_NODE_287_length_18282_cov_7.052082_7_plen_1282_part_00
MWMQPGELSSQAAGYRSQPVVDYNVAFANSPLQPPLHLNFSWVWHHLWGGVGVVFRAHGTTDFYEISFPAIGQAQRSEMVWLLISRVRTAQSWREAVHFAMLPGVASEPTLLHHTSVEVGVSHVVVTVDDRAVVRVPLPADHGPFRVGASSYILSDIEGTPGGTLSNFSVAGMPPSTSAAATANHNAVPFAWTPAKMASSEVRVTNITSGNQGIPRNPFGVGQIVAGQVAGNHRREKLSDVFMINANQLLHNSNGLSLDSCSLKAGLGTCSNWSSTDLPPIVSAGILATAAFDAKETGGAGAGLANLTVYTMDMNSPTAPLPQPQGAGKYCINGCVNSSGWVRILRSRSSDSGRSWTTDPQSVWSHQFHGHGTRWNPNGKAAGAAAGDFVAVLPSQILQLSSGKLLFMFEVNTLATESGFTGAGGSFLEQPPPGGVMYSLTSYSDGKTWEKLANLDGPPYITTQPTGVDVSPVLWVAEARGQYGSEIAATELSDGRILAFIRPHYSPFMIEGMSTSEGADWSPLAKGHFPMYACGTAAITTDNGAVLVGGRLPGQGLQVSWDSGVTFQTFQIDTTGHGQGSMIQVAPNVVLFVYGGPHLRQQLIRVKTDPREITPMTKLEADQLMAAVRVDQSPRTAAAAAAAATATAAADADADADADAAGVQLHHRGNVTVNATAVLEGSWEFLGGNWTVSSSTNGTDLTAPDNTEDNFAFYQPSTKLYQGSLQARFDFQWQYFFSTAGFIFGASNSSSFYQLDLPWNSGGPMDAKPEYMYASLSRVQEVSGWREQGMLQLLHGVSCNPQLWHSVVVDVDVNVDMPGAQAAPGMLTLTVDGRTRVRFEFPAHWPAPSGFVGLATYSTLGKVERTRFRNFRVVGERRDRVKPAAPLPLAAGRVPAPEKVDAALSPTGVGNIVSMGDSMYVTNCGGAPTACWLLRAPIPHSNAMPVWTRDPEPLPEEWITAATEHGVSLRATHQQLEAYFVQSPATTTAPAEGEEQRIFRVGRATSTDGSRWTTPQTVWRSEGAQLPPPPPNTAHLALADFTALGSCQLLERRHTPNGKPELVMFLQFTTNETSITRSDETGVKVYTLPAPPGTTSFTVRSRTGGLTWSEQLTPLNGAPCCYQMVNKGQSQISATELNDGRLLALLRPDSWAESMWEVWSDDAAVDPVDGTGNFSWGPLARGHFPMYASPDAMLTTAAGVILIGGRFPAMSVQASWDNGQTWSVFSVDTQFYGYGAMHEIAPAVVVFLYGGELDAAACACAPALRQVMFRVESDRIVAVGH